MSDGHTLIARLDNAGDVLLAGPAARAAAAGSGRVTMLVGPAGADAARLLPGVQRVLEWQAPWVGFDAHPVEPAAVAELVAVLRADPVDRAAVLCSFHQSPLPLALLLRLAGAARIAAVSTDHPGALLDHRLADDPTRHEVRRNLDVLAALGCALPPGDDGCLRINATTDVTATTAALATAALPEQPYVVLHPGASVPSRAIPAGVVRDAIERLAAEGWGVVVTGSADERIEALPTGAVELFGRTDLASLAAVLAGAAAVVSGNTGPAHLAAAVATPVVSVFAPVVEWDRWRPWRVPSVRLGDQHIECAGCRVRTCPLERQRCLDPVTGAAIGDAVRRLTGAGARQPRALLGAR